MQRRSFVFNGLGALALGFATPGTTFAAVAGKAPELKDAAVTAFAKTLKGAIYRAGAPEYEKRRKGFAAKVDLHPALVVHAVDADDVSKAVLFARAHRLPLAVRGGGHSYAGYSTCEGGLVIDMSGLGSVVVSSDGATVRAGGGVLSHAIAEAAATAGRAAVLGQCPSVGIGGYLTGGGVGPLMSAYGLGCDNVLEAEVVLADGRIVTANARQNPDLYWAIRGGGGNFGVVTAFTIALHPAENIYGGFMVFGASNIADLLRFVQATADGAPDVMTLIAILSADGKGQFQMYLQVVYVGEAAAREAAMAPLRASKMLLADQAKATDAITLESAAPMNVPPAYEQYEAGFLRAFDDDTVKVFSDIAARDATPFDLTIVHMHGAVTRVPATETAFPLRAPGFAIGVSSQWAPATGPKAAQDWIAATAAALRPFSHGAYVNVMDRDASNDVVRDAYGENYARLSQLKAKYDQGNLFALNQNIVPG